MSKRSFQGAQKAFYAKLSHANIGNMTFFEVKEQGESWKRLVTRNWAFLAKFDAFDF